MKGLQMNEITKYKVPAEIEKKILTAIELKKELEQYEAEIKNALKEAMEAYDIVSVKNDKYSVTLATRKSYKAVGEIPKEFTKPTLDTTRVSTYVKLNGEVPEGIEESETKHITWRAK
jgi:hypothetical protein